MKLKRIIATVVAIASFASMSVVSFASSVSNADNFYTFKTEIVPATFEPGDPITINCYVSAADGEEITVGKKATSKANFSVILPADVVNVDADTDWYSDDYYISEAPNDPLVTVSVDEAANVTYITLNETLSRRALTVSADSPLFSIELLTKETAPAGTFSADLNLAGCSLFDGSVTPNLAMSEAKLTSIGTATVNGAIGPQGPVATKGETAANGITEYTVANDDDLAGKKVMMSQTFTQQAITEATRFVVTWNGDKKIFGSDLYAKLGGQEGEITIGSLTFGLIVDDANAKASDFTFEIK